MSKWDYKVGKKPKKMTMMTVEQKKKSNAHYSDKYVSQIPTSKMTQAQRKKYGRNDS